MYNIYVFLVKTVEASIFPHFSGVFFHKATIKPRWSTRQGFTSVSYDMESAMKFATQGNQGRSAKRSLLVIEDPGFKGTDHETHEVLGLFIYSFSFIYVLIFFVLNIFSDI